MSFSFTKALPSTDNKARCRLRAVVFFLLASSFSSSVRMNLLRLNAVVFPSLFFISFAATLSSVALWRPVSRSLHGFSSCCTGVKEFQTCWVLQLEQCDRHGVQRNVAKGDSKRRFTFNTGARRMIHWIKWHVAVWYARLKISIQLFVFCLALCPLSSVSVFFSPPNQLSVELSIVRLLSLSQCLLSCLVSCVLLS